MGRAGIGAGGKAGICTMCRSRSCCYHYRVSLTMADVRRIARALDLSPAQFTDYLESDGAAEQTFILDTSGTRYELILARSAEPRRRGGCTFLVRTNEGVHRCGLGALRPHQCRLYPAFVEDGLVRVINDTQGCWRTWSVSELDLDAEHRRSEEYEQHRAESDRILEAWNRRVWRDGDRERTFREFCDYLENHA